MEDKRNPLKPGGKRRFNFYWIYIILTVVLFALYFGGKGDNPKEDIEMGQLIELLQKGEISKIELINKVTRRYTLRKTRPRSDTPTVSVPWSVSKRP